MKVHIPLEAGVEAVGESDYRRNLQSHRASRPQEGVSEAGTIIWNAMLNDGNALALLWGSGGMHLFDSYSVDYPVVQAHGVILKHQ